MRALVVFVVLGAAIASAQVPQSPVRDQTRVVFGGTAVVSGTVVLDDDKRPPLRRATVTLTRQGVEDIRSTSTDEAGAYRFTDLPAGTYLLVAGKGGHISVSYGAPKPGMPGRTIVIADGQQYAATPIAIMRGAVIAGRLFDRAGQPVPSTSVQAVQVVTISGERRKRLGSGTTSSATTNDHGEYRIFGLLPGEYVVFANVPGTDQWQEVSPEELTWVRKPDGPGPRVGRRFSNVPTLFPGVVVAAAASSIALTRGEERLGADFALQYVPAAKITGVVTGLDGRPAAGIVVERALKVRDAFLPSYVYSARSGVDGAFVFDGVAPGDYELLARGSSATAPGTGAVSATPVPMTLGASPAWGVADVSVGGADRPGITIALRPGMTVSGSLVVQGTTKLADLSRVRIQLMPMRDGPVSRGSGVVATADAHFRIEGVTPGRYRLVIQGAPAPFQPRSAMLGELDVLDSPFEVRPNADVNGITVTLTDSTTEISGSLRNAADQPVLQVYVVVFAVDRANWEPGSRRIGSARASESGTYTITGLPPGDYFLCALTELDPTLLYEASYLQELAKASITLSLADGEKKVQHLRAGGIENRSGRR